jgi:hypothetical protein
MAYQAAYVRAEVAEFTEAAASRSALEPQLGRPRMLPWAWIGGGASTGLGVIALLLYRHHAKSPGADARRNASERAGTIDFQPPSRVERAELAARFAESDRIAPRWAVDSASSSTGKLVLCLRNQGAGAARRVQMFGLAEPAAADLHPLCAGVTDVEPDGLLTVVFRSPVGRVAFHIRYEDDAGLTWWCPLSYWETSAPPLEIGRLERDRPSEA